MKKVKSFCLFLLLLFTIHLSLFTVSEAMINLGEFKAGTSIFYGANFHNDTGTIEDPTSPEAQQRTPAGVWSNLTTPAKQNSKTGFYGGTIDTTSYAVGQYIIRMAGTVATAKTIATVFSFTIVADIESDTYAAVGSIPTNPLLTNDSRLNYLDASIAARPTNPLLTNDSRLNYLNASIAAIPTNPTLQTTWTDTKSGYLDIAISSRLATSGYTAPDNINIGLIKTVTDKFLFDGSNFVKSVEQVKTGYSLTQTFPAHFADLAITETTGKVTVGTNSDKTGYSLDLAYDAAKTAATQSSVNDIDTSTESAARFTEIKGSGWTDETLKAIKAAISGGGTDPQVIRDAMKLAPTAGDPATGSVDKHLDDIYAKPLVTLPAMQARVYSAFLIQNQITKIKQGDTPRINFEIAGDWSTWTARFGVKESTSDTTYKIGPKDCVIGAYDPVTGTTAGYVDLTTTDTATAGTKWLGEIELKQAGSVQTLINYLLTIEADVIK